MLDEVAQYGMSEQKCLVGFLVQSMEHHHSFATRAEAIAFRNGITYCRSAVKIVGKLRRKNYKYIITTKGMSFG